MKPSFHRPLRLLLLAGTLLLSATLSVSDVCAQFFDARRMAMGGVVLSSRRDNVARVNPAYRAVPPAEAFNQRSHSIPLPIGLVQAIRDFPSLDPDDEDFDLIEIVNYGMNIPWAWQFNQQDPPSSDVEIGIAQDAIIIDLKDAQQFVPDSGFDAGGMRSLLDLGWGFDLGREYGVLYLSIAQGFVENEVEVGLDDALERVLAEADPIVGGNPYGLEGDALGQVGFSSGLIYAREIPLLGGPTWHEGASGEWQDEYWESEEKRPRLWVGMGLRRYTGVAYARADGTVDLIGEDPILGSNQSFRIDYEALYTTADPNGLSDFGHSAAVDLGAVFRWREWEVGAGVADLLARLTWENSTRDRFFFDEVTNQIEKERVATGFTTTTDIPTTWRINTRWQREGHLLAADLGSGPGGKSFHFGAETWLTDVLALRGGLERDTRGDLQGGWGMGLRAGKVGLDVGFQTHSRNVTGERQIAMGLALVLY